MKRIGSFFFGLALTGGVLAAILSECRGDSTLIAYVGGRVIDGNGGTPLEDATIITRDGRFVYVGPGDEAMIPTEAQVVDITGFTVVPGFFNTHVHEPTYLVNRLFDPVDVSRLSVWANEGVTTVRDVTSPMESVQKFKSAYPIQNDPTLARVLFSGPCFEVPGGRAEGINRVIVTSVEDARIKTEQLLDNGVDLVKLYLEDGSIFGRSWNVMTTEESRMIVSVAHARGVKATAHVHEAHLVKQALDAGVDDICHAQVDQFVPDDLIDRMVEQDVYLIPTLEMCFTNPQFGRVAQENVRRMNLRGVKLGLGNDYSATYSIQMEIGMPLNEMLLMQGAGLTPMEIIVAGTKNGAAICGIENDLGTIEVGKIADLVVVHGDPLLDLHTLKHDVVLVVRDGVIIRDDRFSPRY